MIELNNNHKSNDKNLTNDKNLSNDDKVCLICLENNGIFILCSKCKYKYCQECATKVNKLCSVCIRTSKLYSNNLLLNVDLNDYGYVYENFNDYGLENSHNTSYFYTLTISIILNSIIGFCWLTIIIFFGYICFKFLFNFLYSITNYIVRKFFIE